jgi:hypothetical protein
MANSDCEAGREQALGAGSFYGSVEGKRERCGAIFTNLRHASPRKLPSHSHELPFFALLLEGEYGERYQRRERQFRPFTIHFRPAGVPHQDEVGPRGVRFFEIEIQPGWRQLLADGSAALDLAHDDCQGGRLLWLGVKMFRDFQGATVADALDDLSIESLLVEMLGHVARMRRENVTQPPAWLGRITEKLAAEYCQRLTWTNSVGRPECIRCICRGFSAGAWVTALANTFIACEFAPHANRCLCPKSRWLTSAWRQASPTKVTSRVRSVRRRR